MTSQQERRVIEALQALTGGLTVTEQDILTANNRLKGSLEPSSPRRRLAMVAIVAAAAVVAGMVIFQATDDDESSAPQVTNETTTATDDLLAALDPDAYAGSTEALAADPAPTLSDLAGVWVLRPYGDVTIPMQVTGNGSYRYGPSGPFAETTLTGHTWVRDTFGHDCPRTQTYTSAIGPDGSLRLQVAPEDNTCTITDGREVFDPVAPGTPVADYLLAVSDEVSWQPVGASEDLAGFYVAPATGHVLDVDKDGSYRFYDSLSAAEPVPADQGELSTEPGALAGSCTGGTFSGPLETARFPEVEDFLAGTTALRLSADKDQCASSLAANDLWVRLVSRF